MFYIAKLDYLEEKVIIKEEVLVDAVSFTDAEAKIFKEFEEKSQLAVRSVARKIVDNIIIDTPDGIIVEAHMLEEDIESNRLLTRKYLIEVTNSLKEVFVILEKEYNETDFIKIIQTKISRVIQ